MTKASELALHLYTRYGARCCFFIFPSRPAPLPNHIPQMRSIDEIVTPSQRRSLLLEKQEMISLNGCASCGDSAIIRCLG